MESRRFSKRVPEQEDPHSVNVSKSEEDGVVVSGNGKVLRDDAVVEELSEVVASEFISDFVSNSVPILVYEDFAICFKISGEGSILIGDLSSKDSGRDLKVLREELSSLYATRNSGVFGAAGFDCNRIRFMEGKIDALLEKDERYW
ncbi:hypothetical protein ACOSQ2_013366 [Xanthoceras sorbifolium]